ncbi:MAG: tetratricopeptide repeat protein [Anaerolineae bacterium]|nr:tetratricopeptide repeat protein [Anaerolineae bacterium]
MSRLEIHLLGSFYVVCNGVPVTNFESNKVRALLAFLAVEADRPHPRETLAGLLWPDQPDAAASHNLRQALSNLRQILPAGEAGTPFLRVTRQTLQFNTDSDYGLDTTTFANLIATSETHTHQQGTRCETCRQNLEQAEVLYRAEFLAGFFVDSVPFEEWVLLQRERYHRLALSALAQLTDLHAQRRNYDRAIHYARRLATLDPWREEGCQQLMRLLARAGQYNAALAQYETCRKALTAELGVEPMPETTALYERIRAARNDRRRNLPVYATPFIGREEELTQIADLLANPACRLLTLVGPGGIGKTRLAAQAAAGQSREFLNGVGFVSLAAVGSTDLIASAIADALDFSFTGQASPRAQLLTYLAQKEMLLALDNIEHLLHPSPETADGMAELVVDILRAAPQVKLLITSRERVNLHEEWVFDVAGLAFPTAIPPAPPAAETPPADDMLATCSAVQLFIQALRRIRPKFSPTAEDYYFIGCICHILQGVPLGIELAAGWGRLFSCREIFSATQTNFDFLTSPLRNIAGRHQSLRAVFEHSWQLLSAVEQAVLSKLSVFRGAFWAEAACGVADAAPDTLLGLVNKSCLTLNQAGQYHIHALLKQYISEKLAESPPRQQTAHQNHCAYYAQWLRQHQAALKDDRQTEILAKITVVLEDVGAAWRWAAASQNFAALSDMLEGVYIFYRARGRYQEGQGILALATQSLVANDEAATLLLGKIWARQADLAGMLGHYDQAQTMLQKSQEIFESLGAQTELAFSLEVKGRLEYWFGRYHEAQFHLQTSVELYRQTGDRNGLAQALNYLGNVLCTIDNDYDPAIPLYQESLALSQAVGDQAGIARVLTNLGAIAQARANFPEAQRLYQESAVISRAIGDRRNLAISLTNLGEIVYRRGEYDQAKTLLQESLELKRETGNRQSLVYSLKWLGMVAGQMNQPDEAKRWYNEAIQISRDIGADNLTASVLLGVANLMATQGKMEQAVELLYVVLRHTHNDQETTDEANDLLNQWQSQLSPQAVVACQQRVETTPLTQIILEILA